jgi:fumarylacetoacetase
MQKAELSVPGSDRRLPRFYRPAFITPPPSASARPDNPLLPNYRVAADRLSRARPRCRLRHAGRPAERTDASAGPGPVFGPSKRLDYEVEIGFVVGPGNALSKSIDIAKAEDHLFGVVLLNDWSARDIQTWEYQPLGPFLAKSFATTISPWIVTMEALEPFRCRPFERDAADPRPLSYLSFEKDRGIDISLEMHLRTPKMKAPVHLARQRAMPTGPQRRWWRTTLPTVATCNPATCSARARFPARRRMPSARSWS